MAVKVSPEIDQFTFGIVNRLEKLDMGRRSIDDARAVAMRTLAVAATMFLGPQFNKGIPCSEAEFQTLLHQLVTSAHNDMLKQISNFRERN